MAVVACTTSWLVTFGLADQVDFEGTCLTREIEMASKLWRLSPSPVARTSFWILYLGWTMQSMPCMVASFEGHSCFYRTLQVRFLFGSKDVNYLQIVTLTTLGLRANGQTLTFSFGTVGSSVQVHTPGMPERKDNNAYRGSISVRLCEGRSQSRPCAIQHILSSTFISEGSYERAVSSKFAPVYDAPRKLFLARREPL